MEVLVYKDSRGYKRKLTKENFDRLPESFKSTLTIWEEPIVPEFLKQKDNGESESIQSGNESGNNDGTEGSTGSSKRRAGKNS